MRVREDLKPGQILGTAADANPTPPDEVKKDPARLAKWQQDQAERRKRQSSTYSDYDVFEVSGCGHSDPSPAITPPAETAGASPTWSPASEATKP